MTDTAQQRQESALRVRPARHDEYEKLVAFGVQRAGRETPGADVLMSTIRHDPRFDPEHLRVVDAGGEYAGLVLLLDRMVRFGAAEVRCAILVPFGVVGLGSPAGVAAMRDIVRLATTHGFQLAMRWAPQTGIDQGFGPGQKNYTVVLPPLSVPVGDGGYTTRFATAADARALATCYHSATANAMLAELRSDELWQWRTADDRQQVVVAVDPLGDVRGYVRVNDDGEALYVHEVAIVDDGPAPALFEHLRRLAAGRDVRVTATPDNRWSRWAFVHGATYVVGQGDGRGAVRVLDLRSLLQAVRPELERRLLQSEFAGQRGRLRLETALGSLGLIADGGRLLIDDGRNAPLVTLPWGALSALMTGNRDAESLVGQPGVRIEGVQALRLLQVLFPERHAHWSPPACF